MSYQIAGSADIGEGLQIGDNSVVGEGVSMGKHVTVGRNVSIAQAIIEDGVTIEDNAVIGYSTLTGWFSQRGAQKPEPVSRTRIGQATLIRTHSVVYAGAEIGYSCWVGHGAVIREKTVIGHDTSVGTMSDCEGHLRIGSYCSIHSHVFLASQSTIEDYVFVAPFCVLTDDSPLSYRRPQLRKPFQGATIKFGAQIGANTLVLPRVIIGRESIVGASSLVTRNVPDLSFCMGSPARVKRPVTEEERLPVEVRKHYGEQKEEARVP